MGFKVYRLFFNWTIIFPNGYDTKQNKAELQHYCSIFDECKKYENEPLVSICHLDTPMNLAKSFGGWVSREMVGHFARYAEKIMKRYKDKV